MAHKPLEFVFGAEPPAGFGGQGCSEPAGGLAVRGLVQYVLDRRPDLAGARPLADPNAGTQAQDARCCPSDHCQAACRPPGRQRPAL